MYTKTITYTDYDGNERTEDFCFNLNEVELMDMRLNGTGMADAIEKIAKAEDKSAIIASFKELIRMAYGEKSNDGRRFMKSDGIFASFAETNAYPKLFMELGTNDKAAADFINGIMPQG